MKQIRLNRKEEEWIRTQIASTIESLSGPMIEGVQNNVWDDKKFVFDKRRFEKRYHEEIGICERLFEKLRLQS